MRYQLSTGNGADLLLDDIFWEKYVPGKQMKSLAMFSNNCGASCAGYAGTGQRFLSYKIYF